MQSVKVARVVYLCLDASNVQKVNTRTHHQGGVHVTVSVLCVCVCLYFVCVLE